MWDVVLIHLWVQINQIRRVPYTGDGIKKLKELQTFVEKNTRVYLSIIMVQYSNGYGDYNEMHIHEPKRVDGISGVYYVDVPDKNMGAIYFEDGTQYEPKDNRLLLFPSYLKHGVRKTKVNSRE